HSATVSLTVNPAGGSGNELIVDGGFESATTSGNSAPGWTATPSPSHNEIIKGGSDPHAGTAYAELGGSPNQPDLLPQSITIPSNATAASLTFWTNIVTQETANTGPYDFLYVNIVSGSTTTTKLTLNNNSSSSDSNTNGTYFKPAAIDLLAYKGSTITL